MSSSRFSLLLLGLGPAARVLEVSSDGGARARALRAAGALPLCVRASREEAAQLREAGFEAAAIEDLVASPSFDAALVSAALGRTGGGEWVVSSLAPLLARVAGAVKPGGLVVLALPNPLLTWPLVGAAARRLQGQGGAENGEVGPLSFRLPGERALRRSLEQAGLAEVRVFAALPSAERPKFLVPLGDRRVVRYFFAHLVPRARERWKRLAVRAAEALPASFFERLAPAYEACGRREGRP